MASPSGPPAIQDDGGEENRKANDQLTPVIKVDADPTGTPLATPDMSRGSKNAGSEARLGPVRQPCHNFRAASHLPEHHLQSQVLGHQDPQREAAKRDQENIPSRQSQRGHPARQSQPLEGRWFHHPTPSPCRMHAVETVPRQPQASAHSGPKNIRKSAPPVMDSGHRPETLKVLPNYVRATAQPFHPTTRIWYPTQARNKESDRLIVSFVDHATSRYLADRPQALEDTHIFGSILHVLSRAQHYYPGKDVLQQQAFSYAAEVGWRSRLPFGLSMNFSTIVARRGPASLNAQQPQLDGVGVQFGNQTKASESESASPSEAVAEYHKTLREHHSEFQPGKGQSLIPYQIRQPTSESGTQRKDIPRLGGYFDELEYNVAVSGGHPRDQQAGYPSHVDTTVPYDQISLRGYRHVTTRMFGTSINHHDEIRAEARGMPSQHFQGNHLGSRKDLHAQERASVRPERLDEPHVGKDQAVSPSPVETEVTEYPSLFAAETQPIPKEYNVLRMLSKNQTLPTMFRRVLSADIVKKVLFLALHGIPSAAIAYEVQSEFPKPAALRVDDRIEKIGLAIDHYLPQLLAEVEREGDPNDFICKLLSYATSKDWIPRSLHNAIEYIYSETTEGALTGSEVRREAAKARIALHKWRSDHDGEDPNPSHTGKRYSTHGSSPDAKRLKNVGGNRKVGMAYRGLQREKQDYQHLAELGYRKGDDDHEKLVMFEWLKSIKEKKRLPDLLEAADLIRGE
ncbi:hypothetical protein PV08_06272 [Exophiala spinifera]|uniref:Uncharacterized protein n=1 Tax=Exophiala spinifera TaxID=91928 RepID=A0A0D1YMG0_9EURO|nr:uncharacterized protein PV08_06272 [Exophiala spinifera]KIW16221.1 hypothetical protein PV08_06272 [Exophiala spinifera]